MLQAFLFKVEVGVSLGRSIGCDLLSRRVFNNASVLVHSVNERNIIDRIDGLFRLGLG